MRLYNILLIFALFSIFASLQMFGESETICDYFDGNNYNECKGQKFLLEKPIVVIYIMNMANKILKK